MAELPKIVVRRLRDDSAVRAVHPDPNLVNAFVENSLPDDARAQVVQHIAQCADCREVVFLSLPDQSAMQPAMASVPTRWLTWPVLRWGAAVAAVMVVGAAISLHRPSAGRFASSSRIQQTDAPIAKAVLAPPPEERRELSDVAKIAPAVVTNGAASDMGTHPDQVEKQSSRMAASPLPAMKPGALGGKVSETVEVTAQTQVPAENAPVEGAQVVPGRAKDADNGSALNTGGGIGGAVAGPAVAFRPRAAMLAPAIAPRWTLTSEGTLQRSLDFGRSWQTITVARQASFRALAASAKDIWVGGGRGSLYHSADAGQNWTQVQPLAAGHVLTDDIIGVEFPDSLHGKLTTSGKETWITEDGGQSWNTQ
jgi:hypothetical protein